MKKAGLLSLVLFLMITLTAYADGFSTDVDAINEAAKSVLMLSIYDANDELIATASGFVVKNNMLLLTNYHVIEDARYLMGHSDDGFEYIINKVYLADPEKDLALLGFYSPTNLTPLELSGDEVKRAESVVAIGSPKGLLNTVSMGNVSALFEDHGIYYIQFTAPISSGSSGGALFNDDGKVIGISTMTYDDGGVVQNLNFAVSSQEAIALLESVDMTVYSTFEDFYAKSTPSASPSLAPTQKNTPQPTIEPTPSPYVNPESGRVEQPKPTTKPTVSPTPKPSITEKPPVREYETLQKGDKGEKVKRLQQRLYDLEYLTGDVDGIYGEQTAEAVYQFNVTNQLGYYRVATNKTQVLLFDGKPKRYTEPEMVLSIQDGAYAEWIYLQGDALKIHFQVTNIGKQKKVKAFELYVYAKDIWGNEIYGEDMVYYATTTKEVKPGETVYSDYLVIPNRSQIDKIFCAIHQVAYTDGSIYTVPAGKIEYAEWTYGE